MAVVIVTYASSTVIEMFLFNVGLENGNGIALNGDVIVADPYILVNEYASVIFI